ncbi:MAG: DsbA family protein [Burkholderiaceae bacterium]|nr:DsbA family protein [Burkholderiaceae bacterium]MEB2352293.1 DsbA family protein [Burkholderiaceae bacterium]
MAASLEFFFFIGSTYSYLSVSRAAALAETQGVALIWRPFSVRTLMREQNNSPFVGKPLKLRYMWRDIERRAARFGIAFAGIPPYPIDPDEIANRVATLAALEGWCPAFTRAAYDAWFLRHQDPGSAQALHAILTGLGKDADDCIAKADSSEVRDAYLSQTARARELGIFGSPTFVHGTEIFWGDDRLEDAFAWALAGAAVRSGTG